jgi:hypothetical protein
MPRQSFSPIRLRTPQENNARIRRILSWGLPTAVALTAGGVWLEQSVHREDPIVTQLKNFVAASAEVQLHAVKNGSIVVICTDDNLVATHVLSAAETQTVDTYNKTLKAHFRCTAIKGKYGRDITMQLVP